MVAATMRGYAWKAYLHGALILIALTFWERTDRNSAPGMMSVDGARRIGGNGGLGRDGDLSSFASIGTSFLRFSW